MKLSVTRITLAISWMAAPLWGQVDFSFTANVGALVDNGVVVVPIDLGALRADIESMELTLTGLTHSHVGDLDIRLINPFGETMNILQDVGGSLSVSDINLAFSDSAPGALSGPIVPGLFRPQGLASATDAGFSGFIGDPSGPNPWLVLIIDDSARDAGALESVTLSGAVVPEPATCMLLIVAGGCVLAKRGARKRP